MTELEQDVLLMHDEHDLSVEEICAETGLELASVKTLLANKSKKFRGNVSNGKVSFSPEEKEDILGVLKNLALSSDNEAVRVRAAIYLHEEIKGRNEARVIKNAPPRININILAINDTIRKARETLEESKRLKGVQDAVELLTHKAA